VSRPSYEHGLPENFTLPSGWGQARLGDLCCLVNGDAYRESDWSSEGTPIIRIQNLNDHSKPFNFWKGVLDGRVVVESGAVLLAWSGTPGTSFGTHVWTGPRGVLNQHIFRVDLDHHRIEPRWAVLAVNQQLNVLIRKAHGGVGLRHVTRSEVESLTIPLPPIEEQRRLSANLTERMAIVGRARAAAEAQLKAAKALPAAYLKEMFESPKILAWPQRRLGDLMRLRKEVVHPAARPRGREVFVGLEHIASGTGDRVDSASIEMADLTGRKPRFYEGDIVYGYLRPYLNKVWIAEFDGLCSVDQYVYAVDPHKADTRFISAFMRSHMYLARAPVRVTPGQLPRIRTEEVASVMINLPPQVEQQRLIGELEVRMGEAERMTRMAKEQVAAMNALPPALLRRAFSGEL